MHKELSWLRAAALVASFALHAGAYSALGKARACSTVPRGPTQVDFEVVAPEPPPELDEPPSPEPEPDEPEPVVAGVPTAPNEPEPAAEPDAPEPDAPEPAEPVNLTGVTLTNDGDGPGWSSAVGDGSRMQGPLRRPTGSRNEKPKRDVAAQPAKRTRRARAKPKAPAIVPPSDLSRPPRPPSLAGRLLSHYPPDAKRRGIAGRAVVSARIDPDGQVRQVSIASQSAPGFGAACRATVLGSSWSAPLDRDGQPVPTRIRYTCNFQVSR